jgi:hypothetical protein
MEEVELAVEEGVGQTAEAFDDRGSGLEFLKFKIFEIINGDM